MPKQKLNKDDQALIKRGIDKAQKNAQLSEEQARMQSMMLTLMCVGLIYSAYAALTCECAQNYLAGEFVQSTDMWLSLVMNRLGIYFPKEIPFLFVMRNQNLIVIVYACVMLALIGATVARLPGSKFALRSFLVTSAMFLNVRFDASGWVVKIDPWKLENLVMTLVILAGIHYMEAKEESHAIAEGKKMESIMLAQIEKKGTKGKAEENDWFAPLEQTRKKKKQEVVQEKDKKKKTKDKQRTDRLFDKVDNQIRAVQGYPVKREDPAAPQRNERMKASFENIERRNKQTEEMKKRKEMMQQDMPQEQLEFGQPMPSRPDMNREKRDGEKQQPEKKRERRAPDLSRMNPQQREEYEDRLKRKDEKKVRQEKMDAWGMDPVELAKINKEKQDEEKKQYDDGKLFKIYHPEKEDITGRTLKDDLRIAAKHSAHKRNRSPDDGFQLVGDRRKNVNVIAAEDSDQSSDAEKELSVTEMMEECKNNAMRIHQEAARREHKQQRRQKERHPREEEGKEKKRRERSGARGERPRERPHGEEKPRRRSKDQVEIDYDAPENYDAAILDF